MSVVQEACALTVTHWQYDTYDMTMAVRGCAAALVIGQLLIWWNFSKLNLLNSLVPVELPPAQWRENQRAVGRFPQAQTTLHTGGHPRNRH